MVKPIQAETETVFLAHQGTKCSGAFIYRKESTMDSGMISKIQKAKRYAAERDRFVFQSFQVQFTGDNDVHCVTYDHGRWSCGCSFFRQRGVCSHTMAIERVLEGMLRPEAELAGAESICGD